MEDHFKAFDRASNRSGCSFRLIEFQKLIVDSMSTELKFLVIAAAPRTGSYFMCDLLWSTGDLGRPAEFACDFDVENWKETQGYLSYQEYLDDFVLRHSTPNGICACKAMPWQYDAMKSVFGETKRSLVEVPGTYFIHLRRKDELSQAVSWAEARKSDFWNTIDPAEECAPSTALADEDLMSALKLIREQNIYWEAVLRDARPSRVLSVEYADLESDPAAVLRAVSNWMGVRQPELRSIEGMRRKLHHPDRAAHLERLRTLVATR